MLEKGSVQVLSFVFNIQNAFSKGPTKTSAAGEKRDLSLVSSCLVGKRFALLSMGKPR